MNTEAIVYLLRKTSLTLKDIGNLTPLQFSEIVKELYYQESVDEWQRMHAVANILAAIYNTIPRKRGSNTMKAKDFLSGSMPQRKEQDSLEKLAAERGIKLPSKEIRGRQ